MNENKMLMKIHTMHEIENDDISQEEWEYINNEYDNHSSLFVWCTKAYNLLECLNYKLNFKNNSF
jgi:hypothetical protein